MAKLSFQCLLRDRTVACYLVRLLQLNSAGTVVLLRWKDGPSLSPRWTRSGFLIRETQVHFAKEP